MPSVREIHSFPFAHEAVAAKEMRESPLTLLDAPLNNREHGVYCTLPHAVGEFAHRVRYLNNFSRKRSSFEALVNTVPWWRWGKSYGRV